MSERRAKLQKKWKSLQKKVAAFVNVVKPSPYIAVLYMKEGRDAGIRFVGSETMVQFAEEVSPAFMQYAAATPSQKETSQKESGDADSIPVTNTVSCMIPEDVGIHHLRKYITYHATQHVRRVTRDKVKRGFWGVPEYQPPWWPVSKPFISPSSKQNKPRMKDLVEIARAINGSEPGSLCNKEPGLKEVVNVSMEGTEPPVHLITTSQNELPQDIRTDHVGKNKVVNVSMEGTEPPVHLITTSQNELPQDIRKDRVGKNKAQSKEEKQPIPHVSAILLRSLSNLPIADLRDVGQLLLENLCPPATATGVNVPGDARFSAPAGFKVLKSLEQGDCFFSSLSLLLYGSNAGSNYLRLGTGLHGITNVEQFIHKFHEQGVTDLCSAKMFLAEVARDDIIVSLSGLSSADELVRQVLLLESQLTFRPTSYAGYLQVLCASGFLQRVIQQHQEGVARSALNVYTSDVSPFPKMYAWDEVPLNIMWSRMDGAELPNHVVPLKPIGRGMKDKNLKWRWSAPIAEGVCDAANYGWCTAKGSETMVCCDRCKSWIHPECFGIVSERFIGDKDMAFQCCSDNMQYQDVPKVTILDCYDVHLRDLISLRPGNWVTNWAVDFVIKTSTIPDICGCVPSCAWQLTTTERVQSLFVKELSKPFLVFPIVEGGHWLVGAVLPDSTMLFMDSLEQERRVYASHCTKICRILGKENKDFILIDTIQQKNSCDCGIYSLQFMQSLFKVAAIDVSNTQTFLDTITILANQELRPNMRREIRDKILQSQ